MSDTLTTLKKAGQAIYTEKKSDFIGYAIPVKCEEEAIEFINSIRKKHADARHNCYAYLVGNTSRYSDDGEPQGTAGIVILDVLRKRGIDNAAIVVTRYFGGILLGAGPLARAYLQAAKAAVDDAEIAVFEDYILFDTEVSFSLYQKLLYEINRFEVQTDNSIFEDKVTLSLAVKKTVSEEFFATLLKVGNGMIKISQKGTQKR